MEQNSFAFINKACFFEVYSTTHKPTLVRGRDFYSLTYRFQGKAIIQCNGESLESCADCVTFMPKHLDYTTEILDDVHMVAIHFDLERNDTAALPAVIPVNSPTIRALFQALIKKGEDEAADFSRMAIFYNILAELQQQTRAINPNAILPKIRLARDLMDNGYYNPLFSIDALAQQIGISTSYLRREFLAAYGIAPIQYLKALRIRNAKRLLVSGDCSVTRAATLCGYTSTSYFIQDFRKATGESPHRYQQRVLLSL